MPVNEKEIPHPDSDLTEEYHIRLVTKLLAHRSKE